MTMVSSYRLAAARLSADRRIAAVKGDWSAANRYNRLINEYLRLAQEEEAKYNKAAADAAWQKTMKGIEDILKF